MLILFIDRLLDEEELWWNQPGSNRRPPACKAGALPTELWPHIRMGHGPTPHQLFEWSVHIILYILKINLSIPFWLFNFFNLQLLVGKQGFEPCLKEPQSFVLPLHYSPHNINL